MSLWTLACTLLSFLVFLIDPVHHLCMVTLLQTCDICLKLDMIGCITYNFCPQLDLIGHSVYDFAHPCDHEEVQEILQERLPGSTDSGTFCKDRDFFIRLKCTLTSKGKNVNLKSASYKVGHCLIWS